MLICNIVWLALLTTYRNIVLHRKIVWNSISLRNEFFSFKKNANVKRYSNFENFHTSNLKMMPCCTYTHQGYFQRYQEITHQFLLFLKLTSKLNLLHCKSNHKIFFILKENPKRRTLTLVKIGVKSYTKGRVSFHRWALYVVLWCFIERW